MIPSTPEEQKLPMQSGRAPSTRAGYRILKITLEREVVVTQRVTHTVVVPCGTSEDTLRDHVMHEIHDDEWHDKAIVEAKTPVVIDCREVPTVLGHRPGHWPCT